MACDKTAMTAAAAVAAAILCTSVARASVTNVVDVAALVAAAGAGFSETNGWTMSGLNNYNANCVKFDTIGDWLLSPDYGATILRIEAKIRCSSTEPTKLLYVLDGETAVTNFAACATKDKLESQTILFPADSSVSCVKLKLGGSGNSGVWGIGELKIIVAEPVVTPANLRVVRTGDDWCSLAWENGAATVSNRVDAFSVERGAGEEVLFETGFDNFVGNPSANKKVSDDLPELLGSSFSGVNVYALGATNGICLVGQGKELGIIRYAGCADYTGVRLSLTVKRYPKDNEVTKLAYELNGTTNWVQEIRLTEDFVENVMDLGKLGVPCGAAILIGWYDTPSNRRVLIDSMSIVRTGAAALTPLGSRWLPASQGAASFSTRGVFAIPAKAECRFDVFARNADGLLSAASTVETRLGGERGARLILQ